MADARKELTDRLIARLPFAESGQYVVRDSELSGFQVIVGKRRKTFAIYTEFWKNGVRKAVRKTLGAVGDLNTRQARALAKETIGKIARSGVEEPAEKRPAPADITLHEAWERYRVGHMVRKGRSAGTIASYQDHVERIFKSWRDKPLRELGEKPGLVADRHNAITQKHGPYIANGAMRTLRAIYNHARKTHRELPAENPVGAIDWNAEARRDTGMDPQELRAWFVQLAGLGNPIRREFHLFTLLCGSRPTALKTARLDQLDLHRRVLHLPRPKGGEKKAFDIPLSRAMVRCLIRAIRYGRMLHPAEAQTWLFPADSLPGHLVEHKEDRDDLSKWGNDLRQTYRTFAQIAGVSDLDAHLLMNHSVPGVNAGYITRNSLMAGHLRRQQDRIAKAMLNEIEGNLGEDGIRVLTWIGSGRSPLVDGQPAAETPGMAA
jgi:hypothetical protein